MDTEDVLGLQEDEVETALADFFTIDGLTARQLMPWPMDVFREPAPWRQYDHLSIQDKLESMPALTKEARTLIEMNYTANSGTDAANTAFTGALRWYALGGYTFAGTTAVGGTYKIGNGGMTSLANAISQELSCDRSFGAEVTAIIQDKKGVTVQTRDGHTIAAGHVVCTIPLYELLTVSHLSCCADGVSSRNVLSTIIFEPPLPTLQRQAIDRGMPHKGGKIICQLDDSCQCDIAGTPCGQSPFMFSMSDNYDRTGSDLTALAFTWPDAFSATSGLEDSETVLPALNTLLEHKSRINAYIAHDWANDPYARGAWMSFRPGDMSTYAEALQQNHGKLMMASADWANGFAGFVDGAIEQGAKAALGIRQALLT